MRNNCEIQGVGDEISTAQDDRFAILKNYKKSDIPKAKAIHTINTETGEFASVVITALTNVIKWLHTAEQFNIRPIHPKMNVTGNYPANNEFVKVIFGVAVILYLGLFQFIQHITRTLRKTQVDFHLGVTLLSRCLYYLDPTDIQNVEIYLNKNKKKKKKEKKSKRTITTTMLMLIMMSVMTKMMIKTMMMMMMIQQQQIMIIKIKS